MTMSYTEIISVAIQHVGYTRFLYEKCIHILICHMRASINLSQEINFSPNFPFVGYQVLAPSPSIVVHLFLMIVKVYVQHHFISPPHANPVDGWGCRMQQCGCQWLYFQEPHFITG